jgi:hypothetical protein
MFGVNSERQISFQKEMCDPAEGLYTYLSIFDVPFGSPPQKKEGGFQLLT